MAKVFFSHDQIQERPNSRFPAPDPFQVHYHFVPSRPAFIGVTLDRETGEVNAMAGTLGPLTWDPYTLCLHISLAGSPHTRDNLVEGIDCVVALPSRDIVRETWFLALPLPRGISELEVAGLHTFESKWVAPPSVTECPVNLECRVEFLKDYHSHRIVFVRVIGASIDGEVLSMGREEVLRRYPTYEVDDKVNKFGGSIERLGVMGEIFECPSFPLAPKAGWYQTFNRWMEDLAEEKYLTAGEVAGIRVKLAEYDRLFMHVNDPGRKALHGYFTRLSQLIVGERWDEVRAHLKS